MQSSRKARSVLVRRSGASGRSGRLRRVWRSPRDAERSGEGERPGVRAWLAEGRRPSTSFSADAEAAGDLARAPRASRPAAARRRSGAAARGSGRGPPGSRDRPRRGSARRGSARTGPSRDSSSRTASGPVALRARRRGRCPAAARRRAARCRCSAASAAAFSIASRPALSASSARITVGAKPRQLADLLLGQRRAHQADAVAHAGLVRRRSRRCSPRRARPRPPWRRVRARGGRRRGGGPCGRSRRRGC